MIVKSYVLRLLKTFVHILTRVQQQTIYIMSKSSQTNQVPLKAIQMMIFESPSLRLHNSATCSKRGVLMCQVFLKNYNHGHL